MKTQFRLLTITSTLLILGAATCATQAIGAGSKVSRTHWNWCHTGTYYTRDKATSHGYSPEHVTQPMFMVQGLNNGYIRFLVFNQNGGIYNDHVAHLESTIPIRNGRAVFHQGEFALTIQFVRNGVVLTESGNMMDSGFGTGASASGTYYLRNSRTPDFRWAEKHFGIEHVTPS